MKTTTSTAEAPKARCLLIVPALLLWPFWLLGSTVWDILKDNGI